MMPSAAQRVTQNTGLFAFDSINSIIIPRVQQPLAITNNEGPLTVTGWIVDEQGQDVAGQVDVSLDGEFYQAFHGIERLDVAAHFSVPAYRCSGFKCEIPMAAVSPGPHALGLRAVSQDGSRYYQFDARIVFYATKKDPPILARSRFRKPRVSIIIPVYDQIELARNCLVSLAVHLDKEVPVEVLVVNDGSSANTRNALGKIKGIRLVHNKKNIGFLHSCNEALKIARGEYVWFLNSDTRIQQGALKSLVEVLDGNSRCGAVGSKLIYPEDNLQEAGGIVWRDGSAMNYGNKQDPRRPEYNYVREVDYCSAASLMVRKKILTLRGGFDTRYAPAYYEDTDLCFHIRHELGLKVIYQPLSEVIHVEGGTCGKDLALPIKRYQVRNKEIFYDKWKKALESYLEPGTQPYQASRRLHQGKTLLIIDGRLPRHDQESGARRLSELIRIFLALDYRLIFLPEDNALTAPYGSFFRSLGVEVLVSPDRAPFEQKDLLEERMATIEYVWLCRQGCNEKYLPFIKQIKPSVKHIFDTVDLHHLRLKRGSDLGLSGDDMGLAGNNVAEIRESELRIAQAADITITVTEDEKALLVREGIRHVHVVPNIHQFPAQAPAPLRGRKDIIFIGGYSHPPNVDAAEWLCGKIMPIVWTKNPRIKVYLLGSEPSSRVMSLAGERVIVPGYIPKVDPYFDRARVFISPLRYGAGMKGKIGQALEHALPIVSTSIGVEGMDMKDGRDVLIADDAQSFAEAVLKLYRDDLLWKELSRNSCALVGKYSPAIVREKVKEVFRFLDSQAAK